MCLCCTRASAFRSYHRSKDWTKLAPWGDTAANSPLQLIHNKAALTAVCRHAAKACRMHHHFFPFFSVLGYFPYNSPAVHHHHHHSIHSSRSFHSKSLPPPSLLCLLSYDEKGFRWNNLAIFTPEAPRRILCLCFPFCKAFCTYRERCTYFGRNCFHYTLVCLPWCRKMHVVANFFTP